ncbi:MAG TPA: glycerol kinase [Sphingomicrobium sp.]|nr:glycerol kinase [Sphingomicrobium sp.]
MGDNLLVIDEGTTSTRSMLFARDGICLGIAQKALTNLFPAPGWVEQDAEEIWALSRECAREMVAKSKGSIAAIGITNQRETVVFWSRSSGRALAPAIVWQDRRTSEMCAKLRAEGHEPALQAKTGLLLDPYFSATKIAWALTNWPQLREAGDDLCIGTIESWLVFRLTGGLHISDATNASRTALMDIGQGRWDDALLDLFGVPKGALPEIVDCAGEFGDCLPEHFGDPLPICGLAGDQQSAAIGQACFAPGNTKATFGTGAFVLTHSGDVQPVSCQRLLTTIAWQLGGQRHYALEGSLFVAGSALQWLRDALGLFAASADCEALARAVPDSAGVQFVPAFAGLGAPHWRPDARGAVLGLTLGSTRAHIVRAALEGVANQTEELRRAFAADGVDWSHLRIDGAMAANDFLAQDLADLLDMQVERPANVETTALGAAMLAGLGCGMFSSLEEAAAARGELTKFSPAMDEPIRSQRIVRWDRATQAVLSID